MPNKEMDKTTKTAVNQEKPKFMLIEELHRVTYETPIEEQDINYSASVT